MKKNNTLYTYTYVCVYVCMLGAGTVLYIYVYMSIYSIYILKEYKECENIFVYYIISQPIQSHHYIKVTKRKTEESVK